jgi:hypothetical protein
MDHMISMEQAQQSFIVGTVGAFVLGFLIRDTIARINYWFDKKDAEEKGETE